MELTWKMKAANLGSLMLVVAGCQSIPIDELPANADPSAEISKLETERNDALAQQADVISPYNYRQATAYLDDARKYRSDNDDNKKILHAVAEGTAYLKKAEATVQAANDVMPGVVSARRAALAAKPLDFDKEGMAKADDRLRDVGGDLEDNNKAPALKESVALQKEYQDVELRSLEAATVGPAQQTRNDALREGAKKYAPRTLGKLETKIKDAQAFVVVNRNDQAALNDLSSNLKADAQHLIKVTRESKALKAADGEAIVLQREAEQDRLAAEQQALRQKEQQLQATNAALNQTEQTNAQLAAGQAFRAQVAAAQRRFAAHEAQVLQQGNKVIVRLGSMDFPNGRSTIPSNRFALLKKVRATIDSFAPATVSVQGFTDSTGSHRANLGLSQERAQAVMNYLQSAQTGDSSGAPVTITAEGLGDEQAIASNKTAKGRAQNRRVDVVIIPQASSEVAH